MSSLFNNNSIFPAVETGVKDRVYTQEYSTSGVKDRVYTQGYFNSGVKDRVYTQG